ncbi:MAG: FAD-dependent oxidoreductase [Candidatus Dormibacteraeota bacterium]|nr:FAD-dependent oxidoreductase [Candidatus Dormibacteraeota bacterium]
MAKPVIFTVDDDAEVLGAIERDLRANYRGDYRILKAGSGREALDASQELKRRGVAVGLFLVDERMPGMSGTEFLAEVVKLFPDSKRVLLTAYADTEAAIRGINDVGLDHYLLKPWDPPDQKLYPVLDGVLEDWAAHARPSFDGLRVAGTRWSPQSYALKEFLSKNHVPYQWIDIEKDPSMGELIGDAAGDPTRLPFVLFPDGSTLSAPTHPEVAEKIGLSTRAQQPFYDVIIVGGGPAGLAAATYASSEGLKTLMVEQSAPGGQAGSSSKIENYLGFPSGISGEDLARRAAIQAKRFGAEILGPVEVVGLRCEDPYRVVKLGDGGEVSSFAVVLAGGVAVRTLEADGVERLTGAGVYYGAAMTEAAAYRGEDVCIVGAGNSAGQGALFFSRYAGRVTLLVRGESLAASMSDYLVQRIDATPNIDVRTRAEVSGVRGGDHLEKVVLRHSDTGEESEQDAAGLFVFIGAAPRTAIIEGLLELDEQGYVLTGPDLFRDGSRPKGWHLDRDPYLYETNVPGIFAVGDVRSGSGKRVAVAVGEGSGAVGMVHRYLETV